MNDGEFINYNYCTIATFQNYLENNQRERSATPMFLNETEITAQILQHVLAGNLFDFKKQQFRGDYLAKAFGGIGFHDFKFFSFKSFSIYFA